MKKPIVFPGRKELSKLPVVLWEKLRGKSEKVTKLSIIVSVTVLGIALVLVCVYGILPSLINEVGDQMQLTLADTLYQRTIQLPEDNASQASAAAVFEQPKPTPVVAPTVPRECFTSVLKSNPDVIGRISIDGLNIAYLVTQTDNNDYYLSHGYDGSKSRSGAIFMDYRCDFHAYPLQGHYVLYGHNMKNGSMFHKLKELSNEQTFQKNRIVRFDTLYEDHEWEIFSAYVTGTDFYYIETSFPSDTEWLKFIEKLQSKSLYKTDIKLNEDDVVLTLSTCSYEFDNARFVVHARLIK